MIKYFKLFTIFIALPSLLHLMHIFFTAGSLIMGIGSMVFMVPHFAAEPHSADSPLNANNSAENICRGMSVREQDMGLGPLSSGGWCGIRHAGNQLPCNDGNHTTAIDRHYVWQCNQGLFYNISKLQIIQYN